MAKASLFHGLLVIDKPGGLTSRDVVNRAQGWFPRGTRIGHTGTLDPLATGVLVLCVGAATRLTEYVQRMEKVYRAGVCLGARSDTDDADGTVTPVSGARAPDRSAVAAALRGFIGEIEQVPPAYSAARVMGRRAYDLARRGEEVDLRPRKVHVHGIDLLAYAYPQLDLEVRCGKGTYIRSLARDLGDRLGCGAYVETLRRTRVGRFDTAAALSLDMDRATAHSRLLPVAAAVADLPCVRLSDEDTARLRHGQGIALATIDVADSVGDAAEVGVFDPADVLVAVGRINRNKGLLEPDKVLPPV